MAGKVALTVAALAAMSLADLQAEAKKRDITVTGAGGEAPTEADYRKALAPVDPAAEAKAQDAAKAAKLDVAPFKGGKYLRAGTGPGTDQDAVWQNAQGEEINEDGSLKDKDAHSTLPPDAQPK